MGNSGRCRPGGAALVGIFTAWLLILTPVAVVAQEYSRSINLPPLQLSYRVLQQLSVDVERMVCPVPPKSQTADCARITIADETRSIVFTSGRQITRFDSLPAKATEFSFNYYGRERSISQVNIDLSEYRRALSVKGSEPPQVDALIAMLRDRLSEHSVFLRGFNVRSVFLLLFYIAYCCVIGLAVLFAVYAYKRPLVGAAVGFAGFLGFFVAFDRVESMLEKLLPAFVIYQGNPSWMVRYSAEFTFGGFVLGLIALAIAAIEAFRRTPAPPEKSAAAENRAGNDAGQSPGSGSPA